MIFEGKIQVIGLRYYKNPSASNAEKLKLTDCYFEKGWQYDSMQALFHSLPDFYRDSGVPRENLFFTVANSGPGKRNFCALHTLAFDIDKIAEHDLTDRFHEYPTFLAKFFGGEKENLTVVNSGHGVHLYVQLANPIIGHNELEKIKPLYARICKKLTSDLKLWGLTGEFDARIIDGARILRLPGSINAKPGREPVECVLVSTGWDKVEIDFAKLAGGAPISPKDFLPKDHFGKLAIDNDAIWAGCAFMASCRNDSATLEEPKWYAGLSITSRMTNPLEASVLISNGHPDFDLQSMQEKMEQAHDASGPLTCKKIDTMWNGCRGCNNYEKVTSPILLKSEKFIASSANGFHSVEFSASGVRKLGKPQIEDLRLFFETEYTYIVQNGQCFRWTGSHWVSITEEFLENYAFEKFLPRPANNTVKEFVGSMLRSNVVNENFWNTTLKKINCTNGIYDLVTGVLSPHSTEVGFKHVLAYPYDRDAKAPLFLDFLWQVTCGDATLCDVLMEFFGYALSGDKCWLGAALFLYGEGANGKSTLLDVFRNLISHDAHTSIMLQDLAKDSYLAQLDGKIVNIAEEINSSRQDFATLKNLATGGSVQAKRLYHDPYTFNNRAKMIFACNERPVTNDVTHGFFRRFLLVPFNAVFTNNLGNVDTNMAAKLKAESPGILNLFLDAYKRLERNKRFTQSAALDAELTDYMRQLDPVIEWLEESLDIFQEIDEANIATVPQLYASFTLWSQNCGHKFVPNIFTFAKKIGHRIPNWEARYKTKFTKEHGKSKRISMVLGVRLLD